MIGPIPLWAIVPTILIVGGIPGIAAYALLSYMGLAWWGCLLAAVLTGVCAVRLFVLR